MMEKKTWKGIDTECVGRPGTSLLLNKKRVFPDTAKFLEEAQRMKNAVSLLNKLGEIDHARRLLKKAEQAGELGQAVSAFSGKARSAKATSAISGEKYKPPHSDYICFEPISKS